MIMMIIVAMKQLVSVFSWLGINTCNLNTCCVKA